MNNFAQTLWVEMLKARRSKMPFFTALGFSLFPLVGGFFMIIIRDPEFARRVGLISAKAQISMGAADWPTYLDFLGQGMAVGGIIVFSLIGSWVFGREYADRTVKDLLALPTSRATIVLAKFAVIAGWCGVLTIEVLLLGLGVAAALRLPPVPTQVILQGMLTLGVTAFMTLAVIPPIVFFASAGRGYLPPIGVAILAIAFAQILVIAGWGETFPWSIPIIYTQTKTLGLTGALIVIITCLAGVAGSLIWWEMVDQTY